MTAGSGAAAYAHIRRVSESLFSYFLRGFARFTATSLAAIVVIFVCAWLWYHDGPPASGDNYRAVPASSIGVGSVSGDACGTHGPVVQAWLTNDAGGNLYGVRCADGVVTEVAR